MGPCEAGSLILKGRHGENLEVPVQMVMVTLPMQNSKESFFQWKGQNYNSDHFDLK